MINTTWRLGFAVTTVLWAGQYGLADAGADGEAGARKSQPCLSCHGMEHFAAFSRDELAVAVKRIAAGEAAHIPLPAELTEQDLAEIVAYLSAASRSAD